MTDANVLRFLHTSAVAGSPRHTALVTASRHSLPEGSRAATLWEQTTTSRWAQFNVEALYPQYYADTAAFLDELARRRRRRLTGKKPLVNDRLPKRFAKWQTAISKSVLPTAGARFSQAQDEITEVLTDHLETAKNFILGLQV